MMRAGSRGFSLIEAAIILGVIGLIVGAVWAVGSKVQRSTEITAAGQQLQIIVDNVRGLYLNQQQMTVDNTQATVNGAACGAANFTSRLSCLDVFPVDMTAGAGNPAFHVWDRAVAGGSVVVRPRDINLNIVAADSFGVRFLNLPANVCTEMAARYSTPDQKYNLKAVVFLRVGGGVQRAYATPSGPPDWTIGGARPILPVTPTQASAECATASAVEWVFGLR